MLVDPSNPAAGPGVAGAMRQASQVIGATTSWRRRKSNRVSIRRRP
jgi:hypothetical protein